MSDELVIANAVVVTRREAFLGSIRVADGHIAEIGRGASAVRNAVDFAGDFALPGLVELHTDVLERHAFPRPRVEWPLAAAVLSCDAELAAAGITTVLDSLAVGYVIDSGRRPQDPRPFVEAIHEAAAAEALRADHFLHLRCEVSTELVVRDFEPLAADPLVRLVSLMDHTPGQRQFADVSRYRDYNQIKYGLSDAEMDALVDKRLADRERFYAKHRAEITALCQKLGLRVASHDDATVAHVEEAAAAGAVVAEFPTTIEAAQAVHDWGLSVMAGAPNLVCGRSHSGNIAAGDLAARGLLDILSSDYVPASALHAAFLLRDRCGFPLPAALATVTAEPAARVGLDDRGEISPGRRADLLRVGRVGETPVVRAVWRCGQRVA